MMQHTLSASGFSAEEFFATQDAPSNLDSHAKLANEFVQRHHKDGRKVVLVTVSSTESSWPV
jgi:phosphopantothenate-cysteine ligase